jgi:NAD(P)-dependent dehydrogenase (short-subunit alcohol dehydrogenase family)
MINLKDKVIVVTGGAGLLGGNIVSYLKRCNAVALSLDINTQNPLVDYHLDITNEESVVQAIDKIIQKYGKIDGWVNNAYPRTKDWGCKFELIKFDSWRENVDMHLNGYFLCCQKILEKMKEKEMGSVINMGSIYGVVGPDFTVYEGTEMTSPAGYAAIKGGLVNLTRYLSSYYGKYKIRVNTVSPGGIFDHQPDPFVKNYEKKVPLKRMGIPEDISPSVAFLLSDEASYITGHNLIVDGGWSAI